MFIKSSSEIRDILNEMVDSDLEDITITWAENDYSVDLFLIPHYKKIGNLFNMKKPAVIIASYPKAIDYNDIMNESITKCCNHGRKIYYEFRKDFPLKRDLGQ